MNVRLAFLLLAFGTMNLMKGVNMGCPQCLSAESTWLAYVAEVLSVFYWIRHDSRLKGFRIPHDMGFFVYVFWPVALSWYIISSRGWKKFSLYFLAYSVFGVSFAIIGRALAS